MDQSTPENVLAGNEATPEAAAQEVVQEVVNADGSRREFLCKSAKKLAYVAPLVLLFHPQPACASNGSTLTYWDGAQIQHRV